MASLCSPRTNLIQLGADEPVLTCVDHNDQQLSKTTILIEITCKRNSECLDIFAHPYAKQLVTNNVVNQIEIYSLTQWRRFLCTGF